MNTRQLQYAITLSQVRNYSQVAELLNISQPALSKQIISLESELGIKLFDRTCNPVSLTPAGEYFIQEAQELLYKEDQLLRSMEHFKTGEKGQLVIGISPFRCLYLIPEVVRQVKVRYPGVRVVLHEANSEQLRKDAAEGKYDFAIVNLPVEDSVLDTRPIESDVLTLAVPEKMRHLLPDGDFREIDIADCKALPFVTVGQGQELRQLLDKLCAHAGFHPDIAAETVGLASSWALATAGVGAALLPLQFIKSFQFEQGLTLFTLKESAYTRQPAIVTKKGQYISPYANYAIQLLTQNPKSDLSN